MPPAEDAADEPGHLLAVEGVDPAGQPDLGLEGGVGALHGAVGGGAGVEHLLPAPAVIVSAREAPFIVYTAHFWASPPTVSAARLTPSARTSPKPCRWVIICMSL